MSKKGLVLVPPSNHVLAPPPPRSTSASISSAPPLPSMPPPVSQRVSKPISSRPSLSNARQGRAIITKRPNATTQNNPFLSEAVTLRKHSDLLLTPQSKPTPLYATEPPRSALVHGQPALRASKAGTTYVYGDSTPFPYDMDFVRTIDDAVTCCVQLLQSETVILEAQDSAAQTEQIRHVEHKHLVELGTTVRDAIMAERNAARSPRVVQTGTRLLSAARATVEAQIASLEQESDDAVAEARKTIEAARADVHLALESFLAIHDVPKTDVELSVVTSDEGSGAIVTTSSSFGIQASFEVGVPDVHAWRKTRRVREICEGTIVDVPKTVGFLKKRIEPRPFKLDDLFIRAFVIGEGHGKISFNKKPRKPDCVEIELNFRNETPKILFRTIDKQGEKSEPFELGADDRSIILRLWRFVCASSDDLKRSRRTMKRALFEGRPITEVSPETLCRRIVAVIAPVAREIARRSGARGEIALRKSVGAWERHENFITSEELLSRTYDLPMYARRILDPLCQPLKARQPVAPALPPPSVPPYSDSIPVSPGSQSGPLPAMAMPPRSALRPPPLPREAAEMVRMFPPNPVHTIDVRAEDVSVLEISVVEVLDDIQDAV
ncbi:MAG: hypothetical protein ABI551_19125 [Polyangiaceae bacterium]